MADSVRADGSGAVVPGSARLRVLSLRPTQEMREALRDSIENLRKSGTTPDVIAFIAWHMVSGHVAALLTDEERA